jgi:hypothetical protein
MMQLLVFTGVAISWGGLWRNTHAEEGHPDDHEGADIEPTEDISDGMGNL